MPGALQHGYRDSRSDRHGMEDNPRSHFAIDGLHDLGQLDLHTVIGGNDPCRERIRRKRQIPVLWIAHIVIWLLKAWPVEVGPGIGRICRVPELRSAR